MPAPDPDSLHLVRSFLIRFFHDEPNDDRALLSAVTTLRPRHRDRYALSQAFEHVLEADVESGFMTDLVRRDANRAAAGDEQARDFLERMRDESGLDYVTDPDDE